MILNIERWGRYKNVFFIDATSYSESVILSGDFLLIKTSLVALLMI